MTQEPCIPIGCVVCPQMSLNPPQSGSWGWKIIEMGQWGKDFGVGTAKKNPKTPNITHIGYPYAMIEFGGMYISDSVSSPFTNLPPAPICDIASTKNFLKPGEFIDLYDSYAYGFLQPTPIGRPVNRMSIEYMLSNPSGVDINWTDPDNLKKDNPGCEDFECGSVVAGSIGSGSFRLRGEVNNCSIQPYIKLSLDNNNNPMVSGAVFTVTDNRLYDACGIVLKIVSLCDEGRDFSDSSSISGINYNDFTDSTGKTRIGITQCCNESGSESGDSGNETIDILFDIESLSIIADQYVRGFTEDAANEWNSILQYNNNDPLGTGEGMVDYIRNNLIPSWNGLELFACDLVDENTTGELAEYYGENGPLAACYIVNAIYTFEGSTDLGGTETVARTLPLSYGLLLNTYWLNNPIPYPEGDYTLTEADWREIMRHELGHALGIGDWPPLGTLDENGVLQDQISTSRHIWLDGIVNPLTSQAYNRMSGGNFGRFLVPIEDDAVSGPGSAFVHWEDTDRNGRYPLANGTPYPSIDWDTMVPTFAPGIQYEITDMTRSYFADQGFFRKDTNSGPLIGPLSVKKTPDKIYTPIKFCGCGKMNKEKNIIGIFNKTTGVFTKNE